MNNENLYGLVLIGGESKRMGMDKALIEYHGKAQYVYCYELLTKFCEKVFLSVREDQKQKYDCEKYSTIFDGKEYEGTGPLGGIITAMEKHPQKSWFVLACDLPNFNEDAIKELIAQRGNPLATAFKNSYDNLPEPMCAIYEYGILPALKRSQQDGTRCPRKILINNEIKLICSTNDKVLDNINRTNEYDEYIKKG